MEYKKQHIAETIPKLGTYETEGATTRKWLIQYICLALPGDKCKLWFYSRHYVIHKLERKSLKIPKGEIRSHQSNKLAKIKTMNTLLEDKQGQRKTKSKGQIMIYKHHPRNERMIDTNPTEHQGLVRRKVKQVQLQQWNPSCNY